MAQLEAETIADLQDLRELAHHGRARAGMGVTQPVRADQISV